MQAPLNPDRVSAGVLYAPAVGFGGRACALRMILHFVWNLDSTRTSGVVTYEQVAQVDDGREEHASVLLTGDELRRPAAQHQPPVVTATHQQQQVREQSRVHRPTLRPTQPPLEPTVM